MARLRFSIKAERRAGLIFGVPNAGQRLAVDKKNRKWPRSIQSGKNFRDDVRIYESFHAETLTFVGRPEYCNGGPGCVRALQPYEAAYLTGGSTAGDLSPAGAGGIPQIHRSLGLSSFSELALQQVVGRFAVFFQSGIQLARGDAAPVALNSTIGCALPNCDRN